ncbi:MAG TPA: DUF885 domain-containing protein [Acidimicrobiia bacterium]|jgi:uncharacterized protein (DUF885 family)|nr:DUF885 domain-containing protein [Acidimicrobiia bacterium]
MPTPFEISDRFTEQWAELSPITATSHGVPGYDAECTDFSPAGEARRADLYRGTRSEIAQHIDHPDPIQDRAARVLDGWLGEKLDKFESNKWRRDLNHVYSPFQIMRDVFDVMPKSNAEEWDNIVARLEGFGGMLSGYRECLQAGIDAGDTVAVRQAESVLEQAEAAASDESRFLLLQNEASGTGADTDRLSRAVDKVRAANGDFADWLRSTYLPVARPEDAVGREEYLRGVDEWLGGTIDPEETYEWGWSEVHRIRAEMKATAGDIDSDLTVEEVIELLETDPARSAGTRQDFVDFVSGIQEQAIEQLSGVHFDVPDELKVVTVSIAPPGGPLGAWYVSPSEDFTRPGSIWYAPGERERLPYWQEVSTAYHEGFPGHHLQVGTSVLQRELLSRFQRMILWYSGAGEGWALYAERLMDELGFFEKPDYRFGLLASQLFRSVRVVVDIGCQLGLRIPDDAPLHAGDIWDYDRAVDYMTEIGLQARDVAESEVKRYLGWWGQAISYKVGEREILDIREEVRRSGNYDQRDFHRRMLDAGAVRLDLLREIMT